MPDLPGEKHDFTSDEGGGQIQLFLRRLPNEGAPPVLLLHGASAQGGSFEVPAAGLDGKPRSLADWLLAEGFEPWLLDWRGSSRVVDHAREHGNFTALADVFDFDRAAQYDIPLALARIREVRGSGVQIAAVGHCMGAATLAQAIASGSVTREHHLSRVVLLTLGLFYEPTVESQLKAQGHTLDLLQHHSDPPLLDVDPRLPIGDWPPPLRTLYEKVAVNPHPEPDEHTAHRLCNRLTFMYGAPYAEGKLVPEIHEDVWRLSFDSGSSRPECGHLLEGKNSKARATLTELSGIEGTWGGRARGVMTLTGRAEPGFVQGESLLAEDGREIARVEKARFALAQLPQQFGSIPLRMYKQGARNVRRGWAAPYGGNEANVRDSSLIGEDQAALFLTQLDAITLITGRENRLWQPRGIHRMHDWLLNGGRDARRKCVRHVVPGFAHQDLLWGSDAPERIFPKILDGLRRG